MSKCPYLSCDYEGAMPYSLGNCGRCHQPIIICLHCGEYNRGFARFCRMCGKAIDHDAVEKNFYNKKLGKGHNIVLNQYSQKRLDFVDMGGMMGITFLHLTGNRAVIVTPNGYIYDWDFVSQREINKIIIPEAHFSSKPIVYDNEMFLITKDRIWVYDLLSLEKKAIPLKDDSLSLISLVRWGKDLYGILVNEQTKRYIFGMIDEDGAIKENNELDTYHFSPQILSTPDGIFFFSTNAVYFYSKKGGGGNLKIFSNFPKKSLNISAKLHFKEDMDFLYIPEENNIICLNISSGKYSFLLNNLKGRYYIDYSTRWAIVTDDDGLRICNYAGKVVFDSGLEIFTKPLTFNNQTYCTKVIADKLLFAFGARQQGGGLIIPWSLDEPKLVSAILNIDSTKVQVDLISNIDVSWNFVGLITKANEVIIWQF